MVLFIVCPNRVPSLSYIASYLLLYLNFACCTLCCTLCCTWYSASCSGTHFLLYLALYLVFYSCLIRCTLCSTCCCTLCLKVNALPCTLCHTPCSTLCYPLHQFSTTARLCVGSIVPCFVPLSHRCCALPSIATQRRIAFHREYYVIPWCNVSHHPCP